MGSAMISLALSHGALLDVNFKGKIVHQNYLLDTKLNDTFYYDMGHDIILNNIH